MRSWEREVTAIVLNHATPAQTITAVRALEWSRLPLQSLIVVDNGSPDGSLQRLAAALPGVRLLATGANLGFAGGCNAGIMAALQDGAAWVLLVNSDLLLAAGALDALAAAAAAHPSAGILGPLVLRSDEPAVVDSAGIAYDERSARMRQIAAGSPAAVFAGRKPFEVAAVMGCAMLIARPVFDRVGLLDASYFFSFEDIEFCRRARGAGFACLCVPAAVALHHGQGSIGRRSPRRAYFATRNHLRLAASGPGSRPRAVVRGASVVALHAAHVVRSADLPSWRGLAAVVRGAWHHLLGRDGAD